METGRDQDQNEIVYIIPKLEWEGTAHLRADRPIAEEHLELFDRRDLDLSVQ